MVKRSQSVFIYKEVTEPGKTITTDCNQKTQVAI